MSRVILEAILPFLKTRRQEKRVREVLDRAISYQCPKLMGVIKEHGRHRQVRVYGYGVGKEGLYLYGDRYDNILGCWKLGEFQQIDSMIAGWISDLYNWTLSEASKSARMKIELQEEWLDDNRHKAILQIMLESGKLVGVPHRKAANLIGGRIAIHRGEIRSIWAVAFQGGLEASVFTHDQIKYFITENNPVGRNTR